MPKPVGSISGRLVLCAPLVVALFVPGAWGAGDCACMPCDFDQDGDVDQVDFGHLQLCLSGSGVIQSNPSCQDARLAGHAYVDQQDVAIFRACLGGELQPYPPTDLPDAVLSEVMASNASGLTDEDGDRSDWIEIHNPCRPTLDLAGWFLTDDPQNLQKWAFPALTLTRGAYLVVFASGKDRRDPARPLHTNFQLDKGGEFLALVAPGGQVVVHAYTPQFPEQLADVSYGLAQGSVVPVAKGAQAWYHVPTPADAGLGSAWADPGFPDSAWPTASTGLGFSSTPSAFQVTTCKANVSVNNLAAAESVLADPAKQAWAVAAQMPTVNLYNGGNLGNFGNDQPFPGMDLATNVDDYVSLATASVVIPTAGEWTFGVSSDEGFKLTLTQGSQTFTSSYPEPRTAADTMSVFNITQPGIYALRLEHFDRGGGAELELFAARGYYVMFDPDVCRLVGDAAGGGLSLGGIGIDVLTDIGPAMRGINSSVWIRIPFDLADASPYMGVRLSIRYADGFLAYLNGQEVVRRNAPDALAWNSAATARRTGQQAETTELIDLSGFHGLLRSGRNVLAIHGLNDTTADADFAIVPELNLSSNSMQPQYFTTPTPGSPNTPGALGFVLPVTLDQPHGFRTTAFQLAMSCPTPGALIRYTLDGSAPTAATGLVYSMPITISSTSVVRAAGFKTDFLPSSTTTSTYLFLSDIIRQSPQGQQPGPGWPGPGAVNGQSIDYGMDPDIVNDPRYSGLMEDALLSIPSLSLVTDLDNLFSPSTGIYTHAVQDGRDWERPCSVELVNPGGGAGFQIDAGLRIRGGFSRSGGCPKHSFRLFFRSEYGQKALDYPLFENEGVSSFRKIDLRTEQYLSWSCMGEAMNTFVREVCVRDLQGALGEPYTRSRYYHLYLDGQYWGLYMTEERPEADYAASYFGGQDADYDVIKVEAGPYTIAATDGDMNAWYRLWQDCNTGFAPDEAYCRVQGLNLDGTRNPAYEVLVDVDNTIDNALVDYYTGNRDGPITWYLGDNGINNFYVLRNRNGQSGFKCFLHDCEASMMDVYEDRTGPFPAGQQFSQFNSQYLSQCLAANAEYRMRFADRVQKFMFNGGPLTRDNVVARFMARANTIQTAIIAESARWGDAKIHPPRNRDDHWQPQINWVVNTFWPPRNDIVLSQLKADGLYPNVPAPLFSNYGGQVQSGYGLGLSRPAGATGTIYYTTDGADPRLRGGAVNPGAGEAASPIVIDHNMTVKARIRDNGQWSALVEAAFVTQPAGLVINEFMADNNTTLQNPDNPGEYPDWLEIYNPNAIPIDMAGMYLTDDLAAPTKFQIASGVTIPAGGYLVFWADNHPSLGNLHTNFALDKGGEQLGLYATDGITRTDGLTFGAQAGDVSYGRYPDAAAVWGQTITPTPGQPNTPLR